MSDAPSQMCLTCRLFCSGAEQVTKSRIFHQQESFASNKRAVLGDTLEQLVNLGAIQFRPGSLDDHTPVEVLTIL